MPGCTVEVRTAAGGQRREWTPGQPHEAGGCVKGHAAFIGEGTLLERVLWKVIFPGEQLLLEEKASVC